VAYRTSIYSNYLSQEAALLKVIDIKWSSRSGMVIYRPVYEDGSMGPEVVTEISTGNPQGFRTEKKKIEFKIIGTPARA
jgi:hypothetical protein